MSRKINVIFRIQDPDIIKRALSAFSFECDALPRLGEHVWIDQQDISQPTDERLLSIAGYRVIEVEHQLNFIRDSKSDDRSETRQYRATVLLEALPDSSS